ncbi:bis(5'-nucleosyl)-tetraphosphatase (symmetrical) YqeK [Calorimonas adulescens]|uniref:bis(5'-nucleosyl)-tetraphosphatase (symmetrical) n=1 Tax=Calorimonas adulescens TaxID=2606906 RepID=A0A5D8QCF9_9THEO|nr:bis(5'-nucleosyl)-tetraphosphatase (symmetrical) YqeK [Calorimonas adulescens]TZE82231.1 HD domain-containing protein [Calorimonas adulescens]
MLSYDEINDRLRSMLTPQRYSHSLRVEKMAVLLAEKYGVDIEKARIAGLVHDCAKNIPENKLIDMAAKYGVELDEVSMAEKALIHGPLGARLARDFFGIEDEEILHAIELHTTGGKSMSKLDRIIYLSDFIEEGRDYEGVEYLRELAFKDLNAALLKSFENTINYVISLKSLLHPNTIYARNSLIMEMRKDGGI